MSNAFDATRHRLAELTAGADRERANLAADPTDMAALFFSRAYDLYAAEESQRMELAAKTRAREVFEVRLENGPIGMASAPARLFGRFIAELAESIEQAAWWLNGGSGGRLPKQIGQPLDLRVIGLSPGSARITFSGQLQPHLVGPAALERPLPPLVALTCALADYIYETAPTIGLPAARHLAEALKPVQEQDATAEFSWTAPAGNIRQWTGTPQEIDRLRRRVDQMGEPEFFDQTVEGEVTALAAKGKIEVMDRTGRKVTISYRQEQRPQVQRLSLWQTAKFMLKTERFLDRAANRFLERHQLLHVG